MSLLKYIKKVFDGGYETIYIVVDIHNTILKPSFLSEEKFEYFPYAKETLQILSNRSDVRLIIWTSSFDDKIEMYKNHFRENGIIFDYANENPEFSCETIPFACFEKKFYYDIGIDDKFGFDAELDWKEIFEYFNE